MTNKHTSHGESKPEITPEEDTPAEEIPIMDETAEAVSPMEELQKQLEEMQAQALEYKDGWQRAVAEFQNFKKRSEAERSESYQMAVGNIIKSYLPVLDDLERALASRPEKLPWADGIDLIYRKLKSILEAEGVKRIEAKGQPFDPNFHEAITQEKSETHESGVVIEVTRNGYMLGNKVIRPAMVRVSK
jgi:molecular chaperone GrpE